jgi:hypothetical protein
MKPNTNRNTTVALRNALSCVALAAVAVFAMSSPALAAETAKMTAAKTAMQKVFATPEELFQALVDAVKAGDSKMLAALLGPKGDALVHSGDAVADKQRGDKFAADYAAKHSVTKDGDAKAMLVVGNDDWPMPIPAVKGAKGWTLDTAAGSRELLARRIGANELAAIEVVRAVVDAQLDYAGADRDANGVRDYARKFLSSPGKKDGLYWPTKEGEQPSPLGPLIVQAAGEGYKGKAGSPAPAYHGYYYRILTAQGKDAKGGALNYVVQGRMIGGFAVVAYPAQYGNSGIMTFIANYDGKVYQKDLGDKTTEVAKAMKAYNPDSSWKEVK